MIPELSYPELTTEQRAQVGARFRDDLFGVDSSLYLYQFRADGLYRRPMQITRRETRAKPNPPVVVYETGTFILTPEIMDILIRGYQGAN